MKIRKAIIKRAARAGANTTVFVHKFIRDADGDCVAIVEVENGDVLTTSIMNIQFIEPLSLPKKNPLEFIKSVLNRILDLRR